MTIADELASAEAALARAARHLREEIGAYPRPISGCDAQFNHLLDLRARIDGARARLANPVPVPTSRHPD